MEMVAAAKMRRTVQSVLATRSYASLAWDIISELSSKTDVQAHPLLKRASGKVQRIGLVLIVANRGLSGSFTKEIIEKAHAYIVEQKQKHPGCVAEIILLGKKGKGIRKYQHVITSEFEKPDVSHEMKDVLDVASIVIDQYLKGFYDKIAVAYTDFVSSLRQVPAIVEVLPLGARDTELGKVRGGEAIQETAKGISEYLYEPSTDIVLDQTLRRLVEVQLFQALLESNASEHSARMMAMRNASDAASDMIEQLTFAYNQARQEAITTELADISGGRAALEK